MVFEVPMPPSQYWHCAIISFGLFFGSMSSTLFILNMTFERFYSIIHPHKAASFNTYKRAKLSIIFIIIFSFLYNIPHFFISSNTGKLVPMVKQSKTSMVKCITGFPSLSIFPFPLCYS